MDGRWIFAAIGVVSGAFFVLNTTLDQIPRMTRRWVKAVRALKAAKAAIEEPHEK
ncbi:hypothetical protein OG905_23265 [Streptomyces sp. NBC_00322]|uniref:hypothetical protein n=1 Tax=Streptomyces sp. NBC_00322 TaxID=2975712 RepID=UPI002E2B315A|nr:hypothetical protein [Streptomyces sp. NBC_00322]